MHSRISAVLSAAVLGLACARSVAHSEDTNAQPAKSSVPVNSQAQASSAQGSSVLTPTRPEGRLPCQPFTTPPAKAHDLSANVFAFDQLEHYYRVPGEFTYRLTGDQYGFGRSRSSSPRRTPAVAPDSTYMTPKRRTYFSKVPPNTA